MKTQITIRCGRGFTLTELVVLICVAAVLVAVVLPRLARPRHYSGINCVNILKQDYLAAKIWADDNGEKFPMQVAATNDVMMRFVSRGNAYVVWQMFSNELSSPKILLCPVDAKRHFATNFAAGFSDANISYFFSLNADQNEPASIVFGDDNLLVNAKPVRPGILNLATNTAVEWSTERHVKAGNIVLADGSALQTTISGFQQALSQSSFATNVWVIP